MTASQLETVANLSESFPWVDDLHDAPTFYTGEAGFTFKVWEDKVVLTSWVYVHEHILAGHGPRAWEDFLHAVERPCIVLRQDPKRRRRPRFAVYRLRNGLESTFRMAVLEEQKNGFFLLVTAFDKSSLANDHYRALADGTRIGERCPAFCLRLRDIDPDSGPRPDRVAGCVPGIPHGDCCERQLACLNFGRPSVDGMT